MISASLYPFLLGDISDRSGRCSYGRTSCGNMGVTVAVECLDLLDAQEGSRTVPLYGTCRGRMSFPDRKLRDLVRTVPSSCPSPSTLIGPG